MTVDEERPPPLPALWPWLAVCAVVALAIDLGTIHRRHQGDSLLNILISLYQWTPFLWEQDRYGMLVPLLTQPIRHPLANLLAQVFFTVFSGLAVFYLLARYVLRNDLYPLAATLGATGFVGLASPYYQFEYLVDTSFGLGLALALVALIMVEDRSRRLSVARGAGAAVLMTIAHWVNCGGAVFLVPLVVARAFWLSNPRRLDPTTSDAGADEWVSAEARKTTRSPEMRRGLALLAWGYATGQALMFLSVAQPTDLDSLMPSEWLTSWVQMAVRTWEDLAPQYWPMVLAFELSLGLILCTLPQDRRKSSMAMRAALALTGAALLVVLLTGTRKWVAINGYNSRYYVPPVLFFQCAVSILAATALFGGLGSGRLRRVERFARPALLLAAMWSYGVPSLSGVRADLDRNLGSLTNDLVDGRCTHLAGSYWTVWPSVFHANLVLHERGEGRTIWGLTFRAQPTFDCWKAMKPANIRVAIPKGDETGERWIEAYNYPYVIELETRPTIRIVRPKPVIRDAPPPL